MFIVYVLFSISFSLTAVISSSPLPPIVARQALPPGYRPTLPPGDLSRVECSKDSTSNLKRNTHCCPVPSHYLNYGGNFLCCKKDFTGISNLSAETVTDNCCYLYDGQLGPHSQCCPLGNPDILKPPHCCPLPYLAFAGPNQCCYPSVGFKDCCTLPHLPSGKCCMDPGIDKDVPDVDEPQFDLEAPDYMPAMLTNLTVHSEFKSCEKVAIIRKTFGSSKSQKAHGGVPIQWSKFLGISSSFHINSTIEDLLYGEVWPEIIIPFLFPLLTTLMSIISMIAFLISGAIGWGILYNVRFLGSKKIRMLIRYLLIRMEKFNRYKYEHSFPRQHLRKLIEHKRYHLPRAFQDSDISSDGEPHELQRPPIPRETETMYTPEEIDLFGYDPDNIPMDWIYGDLFGRPELLAKEVKKYIKKKRRPSHEGDLERASLNSEEWADFLRNRLTDKMKREKQTFLTSVRDKVSALESLGNKLMKLNISKLPSKEGRMADRSTGRNVRK